jgi:TolA-binding protein
MKVIFLALAVGLLPSSLLAQRKEIVEVQRDVALLQDSIRNLQNSLNDKLAELKVLVQQALETSSKANAGVAALDTGLRERMREQERTVTAPVANLAIKLDQMAGEFQSLKESINDMNARMNRLQAQVVDLGNQIKVMASPPPPPPPPADSTGPPTPPPGMTATGLYESARRDQLSGNLDLAMQQYADYLKYYGNTDLAPNAQYQIGEILYGRGELEAAMQAFDAVIEKFPDNNKTLDARYMKGMTLIKLKQPTKAAQEFRALIKAAPNSEQATKAKARLKELGLPYTSAAPAKKTTPRRR